MKEDTLNHNCIPNIRFTAESVVKDFLKALGLGTTDFRGFGGINKAMVHEEFAGDLYCRAAIRFCTIESVGPRLMCDFWVVSNTTSEFGVARSWG